MMKLLIGLTVATQMAKQLSTNCTKLPCYTCTTAASGNNNAVNKKGLKKMRKIERIFVHCTASNKNITLEQLRNVFKMKGWKNPGYHFVVFANGEVEQMLDVAKVSNGVKGYNSTAINIAYTGGLDAKGKPLDTRTAEQKKALRELLQQLRKDYPNALIMGHRDIWSCTDSRKWLKACPCFNATAEYRDI